MLDGIRYHLKFTGKTSEYFGIWISNLFLTIVTLGVYSAWAKVRRKQYFYNNTLLENAPFGYHATGLQIFKGRVIVLIGFAILNLIATFLPQIYFIFVIALLFLTPHLVNLSLAFNAKVTSYRNVRFTFKGDYWEAFIAYILMPLLAFISVGLLAPIAVRNLLKYVWNRLSYGGRDFETDFSVGEFYRLFGISVILPVGCIWLVGLVLGVTSLATQSVTEYSGAFLTFGFFLLALAVYLYLFFIGFVYRVFCTTILFNRLSVEDKVYFSNTINPWRLLFILITNFFAIIVTLGFMIPWAQVRLQTYMCEHIATRCTMDFDEFVAEATEYQSSIGEEFADFDGVDLGL